MDHTWPLRAVVATTLVGLLCSCGDGGAKGAASSGTSAPDATQDPSAPGGAAPAPDGSAPAAYDAANAPQLALTIDGRDQPMVARAQLSVTEGKQSVQLGISGTNGDDLLLLELQFDDLSGCWGSHSLSVGLPATSSETALASFSELPYHAQDGEVDLTVAANRAISGTFHLSLAHDPDVPPGQTVTFTPSDDLWAVSGEFSGSWVLDCYSKVIGHQDVTTAGGAYCDQLTF